jgi:hypothetical protein
MASVAELDAVGFDRVAQRSRKRKSSTVRRVKKLRQTPTDKRTSTLLVASNQSCPMPPNKNASKRPQKEQHQLHHVNFLHHRNRGGRGRQSSMDVVRIAGGMKQLDFICLDCPLAECDTESLFCAYRFLTKPNDAQLAVKYSLKADRRQYFKTRYQKLKREKQNGVLQ